MSTASPTIFASGDLVEVLVSFVIVQTRDQYALKPILRALTMLDCSEREVSVVFQTLTSKTLIKLNTRKRVQKEIPKISF